MVPSFRSFALFFCAGCSTPAPVVESQPTPQPVEAYTLKLDHEDPVIAKCVADAYEKAQGSTSVDGVISVDRTGLAPRYSVDPPLPGLLDCISASRAALERGSTSFRVHRTGDEITVAPVPKVESGDGDYEMPPEVSTSISACLLKQRDLRAPQEGAMLLRIAVAPSGVIGDIEFIASTAQFDEGARACLPAELADKRVLGIAEPTVINLKHHVRVGERPD